MKFSSLLLGKKAERAIDFPLVTGDELQTVPSVLVPLTGTEESEVLAYALRFAKEKGAENPKEGEPLYDLAVMVGTIERGCLDPDSPKEARGSVFDGGAAQILDNLPRETIAFLYERQQQWQDECSPSVRKVTADQLVAEVIKLAEAEDDLPFVRLSPGLRWILARSMARQLLSSLGDNSPPGSLSEAIGAELKRVN